MGGEAALVLLKGAVGVGSSSTCAGQQRAPRGEGYREHQSVGLAMRPQGLVVSVRTRRV
jgi:hypothetical protein